METSANRSRRIQITTKGPLRKQAIVPITKKYADLIMDKANVYVSFINGLLRNTKSNIRLEFIRLCPGGISIMTNNVPAPNDLNIIKKYFKSIDDINDDETLPL